MNIPIVDTPIVDSIELVPNGRAVGVVKFFSGDKGYGFITPVDGSKDVYVHRSGLADGPGTCDRDADGRPYLQAQQRVSYVVSESDRQKGDGKMATSVRIES